jgi:RelA/SpoT family (p)ppGpp synthetase
VDEQLIRRAFAFSYNAHINDRRKSDEPYFIHPYAVAMIVAKEIPLDDISIVGALLHDVVEDTRIELKDIKAEFGDTIANIVDGVTKITDVFESHEVTQAESYRKLLVSMVNDIRVIFVKFADRLHNMRTLLYLGTDAQLRMAKETLEIYTPFAHRFGLAQLKWELEDLAFKIINRTEYNRIASQLSSHRRDRENLIAEFVRPLRSRLDEEGFEYEIVGRPKHIFSIYNKMLRQNKPLEALYDLFAVRIILNSENIFDCFTAYGIVSHIYQPIPERFKDYISVPKKNGYQSIHTTVAGPKGKLVEVQIRTRTMDEIAERGVAAHWMYKEKVNTKTKIDKELENWATWMRELFEQRRDEAPQEVMESFKLNLYQDEIYVFTPKNELKILPRNATPVDFAFEIHSGIGSHCIAAKVNGKLVPLNSLLQSGDQVEIITSKNQNPNPDWEHFVVSHKAKQHIRRFVREEQRKRSIEGKEIWEKKLKKHKFHINEDELSKNLSNLKVDDLSDFYLSVAEHKIDPDLLIAQLVERMKKPGLEVAAKETAEEAGLLNKFLTTARDIASGISIRGSREDLMHQYAKCCNPIPGDDIIGFVTRGEGMKIHRRDCKNVNTMRLTDSERFVEVGWPSQDGNDFLVALYIYGKDRSGLLNDITHSISTYQNTNIRSVNIESKDKMVDGRIIIHVKNVEHLTRIIEKIRKVPGVQSVERFNG